MWDSDSSQLRPVISQHEVSWILCKCQQNDLHYVRIKQSLAEVLLFGPTAFTRWQILIRSACTTRIYVVGSFCRVSAAHNAEVALTS